MSIEKQESKVEQLMSQAHRSRKQSELWGIARDLERLSAWREAREVDRLADKLAEAEARRRLEAMS